MLSVASPDLLSELERVTRVRRGILGSAVTTYTIGGPLAAVIEPETEQELVSVLKMIFSAGANFRVLGAGSNLLIADSGVQDIVIKLGRGFKYHRVVSDGAENVGVELGAASALMSVSRAVSEDGLSGLEFAGGIPASIGGAVYMNAGAHGSEMATVLQDVVLAGVGGIERVAAKSLPYRYRHSGLPAGSVVIGATVLLTRGDKNAISARRSEWLKERKARQPLTVPSAGSVFKNPAVDQPAGKIIEECGLKGAMQGGAMVSPLHANWIVNPNRKATAQDVAALMERCMKTVQERTGVALHPEVVTW